MFSLLLRFLIPFLLTWLLVGGVLFAWRRWRERPWVAAGVAAAVVALSPILFRTSWLAVTVVLVLVASLMFGGRRPRSR